MDNVNYYPKMLMAVVERRLLSGDPFMLFDVGCALGIDPVWRFFGDDLHAHAFDPQEEECRKLEARETNTNVRYHASFVGLPPSHEFHQVADAVNHGSYFLPSAQLARSSCFLANRRKQVRAAAVAAPPPSSLESTEQWSSVTLSTRKVSIAEFAAAGHIGSIDFIKIDTDGHDLEVAVSAAGVIRTANILGFMVECYFAGSGALNENSFRNVDTFMQRNGFSLYALTANRYTRAALPGNFLYPAFYQSVSGQPVWGDMIYLRDGGSPDYLSVWGEELSLTKLLKLACLYELFQLPDCAAELLLVHEERLKPLIDPTILLNLLTPRLHDVDRSYAEYLKLFEDQPEAFFPAPRPPSA
jgi:hypothetical protein